MSSLVLGSKKVYASLVAYDHHNTWIYARMGEFSSPLSGDLEAMVIAGSPFLAKRYGAVVSEQEFHAQCEGIIAQLKPRNVIFISSAAVYGLVEPNALPLNEESELAGLSGYALEKISFEQKLKSLSEKCLGTNFTVLRVSGFYNCFDENRENSLVDRLLKQNATGLNETFEIEHGGRQVRDFCDYSFLIELIAQHRKARQAGYEIFNVKTTNGFTIKELLSRLGSDAEIAFVPSQDRAIHSELSVDKLLCRVSDFGMDFENHFIDKVDKFYRNLLEHHR